MQDDNTSSAAEPVEQAPAGPRRATRKRTASRTAGPPAAEQTRSAEQPPMTESATTDEPAPPARKTAKKAAAKKTTAKKTTAKKTTAAKTTAAKKATAKRAASKKKSAEPEPAPAGERLADAPAAEQPAPDVAEQPKKRSGRARKAATPTSDAPAHDRGSEAADAPGSSVLFQPPTFNAAPLFEAPVAPAAPETTQARRAARDEAAQTAEPPAQTADADADDDDGDGDDDASGRRRRRRRGGRGRRKKADGTFDESDQDRDDDTGTAEATGEQQPSGEDTDESGEAAESGDGDGDGQDGASRRRRRRRRRKNDGEGEDSRSDDPPNTVVKVRETRESDEVSSVKGSTRLEAKKQRRREGREAGRRRPPILTESEFLARREAVDRVMAVRQDGDLIQIAVLEDNVLVEHYVSRASQQSMIGNVYLGRVQNVLPAMEAAFVDIGRGRNAVVYAGEVDWAGLGHTDGPKRIEDVLKSGQTALAQVTKDPVGHKGARLTGQVSLPGRYVVYVPGGSMSGISRKLPDNERNRLKKILKKVVPEDAGVIVRTAAEGASEEELTNDVARLKAEWEAIQKKSSGSAPALLHGEPDLAIKVVRDLFNEDFARMAVSGDEVWTAIDEYVTGVASSLRDRVEKWTGRGDVFAALRVDEQIAKALDRKVWLPSGGSLVIDKTEAMTVIDVNTGKFIGSGGNLEETVTKNNLEAAEEIVRQLRLRDVGGIIVIDFIDMVLESNRDLVLRRLVECLGRDRTKHQVAEVTSLGLVQMTRKRIGTGLLEAFSEQCQHCKGRGLLVHTHPGETSKSSGDEPQQQNRTERRGRRRKAEPAVDKTEKADAAISPKLEALASPGEASPADLIPVSAGAETNGTGEDTAVAAERTTVAATPDASAEPAARDADAGDDAAKPRARRGRRRAQRPAGSPDEHAPVL